MNRLDKLKKVNVGDRLYELHYVVEDDGTYRDEKLDWYKYRYKFDTLIKNGKLLFFAKEIENVPYTEIDQKELEENIS